MTLDNILAPYEISSEDYLAALAASLQSEPRPDAASLSEYESETLARWSGIEASPSVLSQPARARLNQATANLTNLLKTSLTGKDVAVLLEIDTSRVRHRATERSLYSFKVGRQRLYPLWQFHQNYPLPGLAKVLRALNPHLHPLEVAGFMNSPEDELAVEDEPITPRMWLIGGGDPEDVVVLAGLIGAGW